jgi:hypothetical protein
MSRPTTSPSEPRRQAFNSSKSRADTRNLVGRARAHGKLAEGQAIAVAQEQVRAVRRKS